MLLTVDIGNTESVLGWFEGRTPVHVWRLASDRRRTGDEIALQLRGLLAAQDLPSPGRIVVASVVPALQRAWLAAGRMLDLPLRFLDGASPVPVHLEVDHPLEVGADRIANTLAAAELYGRDTVVVDLGTATTFDCITADGVFLGGVIAPGPTTGLDQLARATARLPQVEVERPGQVIGRNTLDCLLSGGFYSVVDGIDGIVDRIVEEWGRETLVVATGGLARVVAPHCRTVDRVEPALTITGLAIADRYLFPGPAPADG
ncbi:type III pantothenate kinase [Candidatus Palauibacter sp.]|uniref:type III pantothenate kinase n=1 Tax=Candidatus Palauibacter sp. TaxID=3101350 RepID=UPI003B525D88